MWNSFSVTDEEKLRKDIDLEQLEKWFGIEERSSKLFTSSIDLAIDPKASQTNLIDPKRANALGIMLGRIKATSLEIKKAFLDMEDNGILNETFLCQFQINLPITDEINIIESYLKEKKNAELGRVEGIIKEMSTVPRLPLRINFILYKLRFKDRLQEIGPVRSVDVANRFYFQSLR